MLEIEDIYLHTADDIGISASFVIPAAPGPHPGLIICHGMPMAKEKKRNVTSSLEKGELGYDSLAEWCALEGFATLIFNFRGTGDSGGNFHPLGWAQDLLCALDWVKGRQEVDNERVILMGSSFGAVIAIYVASQRPDVAGIVSFASPARTDTQHSSEELVNRLRDIGIIRDKDFPQSYDDFLSEYKIINPNQLIHRISPRPILLVHGYEDDVVPVENAYTLYERALEPKDIQILQKVGHRFRSEPDAIDLCISWLRSNFM